ncbi:hypothetical protein V5799_012674 [Amblyomma americanum]|uniref:Uncharacterized protein n=1 Tax=Amblyomma americanum TaxID=6943 RepID=A0AAQ4EE06_AMBAM
MPAPFRTELVKAYLPIPVNPENVSKTTIVTPFGLFEFRFMSLFGLRNAGQTFQRFIDEVVRGLDFWSFYLDNIPTNTTSTFVYFSYASMTTAYSSMSQ